MLIGGAMLVFDNVVFDYPKFSLGPISAIFTTGITALLGANGAGKTTMMELAIGVHTPQHGSITMNVPNDLKFSNPGYLPQDFGAPGRVTVREFLEYAAWCRSNRHFKVSTHEITTALQDVDLLRQENHKISTLSGGMLRRLGVAQALLGANGLIILDEPTVGLDPSQRQEFRLLLRNLATNHSVLISTHLSEDVAAVADRVCILDQGSMVFDGTATELVGIGTDVTGNSVENGFLRAIGSAQHIEKTQ